MITFNIDFSHIHANDLRAFHHQSLFDTKPWSDLDLSVLDGADWELDLVSRANELFEHLTHQPLDGVGVLDVLAMTSTDSPNWQGKHAMTVAKHWWVSLLSSQYQVIFACLTVCIYHHQHYLGHVGTQKMAQALCDDESSLADKDLWAFAKAVLSCDTSLLAKHLLLKKITPQSLFNKYPLMIKDDFKHSLVNDWLNGYLSLSETQLPAYQTLINTWLNEKSDVLFAVGRAKMIFDDGYFEKDLQKLESQTHKFGDIYVWLKSWSSDLSFKEKLGHDYLPILRVWIGAGNYYQLEKSVRYISYIHGEHQREKGKNISLNRYFFWTNYQQYIVDYWLLLPKYHASSYDKLAQHDNVKWSAGLGDVPVIVLRFDEYYFIQPLVLKAGECDLVMTSDVAYMDRLLTRETVSIDELNDVSPCLVHDFYFAWQSEMYQFLQEFDIRAISSRIKVAEMGNKEFCIDGLSELPPDEKNKRKIMLRGWYQSADRQPIRQNANTLRRYAKNLRTHGVL